MTREEKIQQVLQLVQDPVLLNKLLYFSVQQNIRNITDENLELLLAALQSG